MLKAFKQYVQNNLKKRYKDPYEMVEGFMFAVVLTAVAQPWLVVFNNRLLDSDIWFHVHLVMWLLAGLIWPTIHVFIDAACYACRFYGDYEVIDRHLGYRAFRITPTQQEYHGLYYEQRPQKKEIIIASAIVDEGGTIWCVEQPGRHHHCIAYMAQHGANRQMHVQGFLTNQYRYVGREDGRLLALQTGQVKKTDHERDLFSEDLWDTPEHLRYKG